MTEADTQRKQSTYVVIYQKVDEQHVVEPTLIRERTPPQQSPEFQPLLNVSPITSSRQFDFVSGTKEDLFKRISIICGNIVAIDAHAIVNAANAQLIMGGGVDKAIHEACRPEQDKLEARLKQLSLSNGGDFAAGSVVWTPTFGRLTRNAKCILKLFCAKITFLVILHAVGPYLQQGSDPTQRQKLQLQNCYTNALDEAVRLGAESIVIIIISIFN